MPSLLLLRPHLPMHHRAGAATTTDCFSPGAQGSVAWMARLKEHKTERLRTDCSSLTVTVLQCHRTVILCVFELLPLISVVFNASSHKVRPNRNPDKTDKNGVSRFQRRCFWVRVSVRVRITLGIVILCQGCPL